MANKEGDCISGLSRIIEFQCYEAFFSKEIHYIFFLNICFLWQIMLPNQADYFMIVEWKTTSELQ